MTLPDLLILRHGETLWNAEGRMQGEADSPLTETGQAQAARQGELVRSFDVAGWDWHVSPQGRAAQTARIAMQGQGDVARHDPRLAEITLGRWSGRLRSEIMAEVPHLFETDDLEWYDHAPGGEGLAALAARTLEFLTTLHRPSVIVTHGITSRVMRCHALGRDWVEFGLVEGGQGVVYHLRDGVQTRLG